MSKIKILSKELINRIAAGEVVERPASALKELLENSIDASSTEIKVEIEDYGFKLIKVTDNGKGIEIDDAELVFEQHATSKISTYEDLNNIFTLGFRGEALASISSVSEMMIESSIDGTKGFKARKEDGEIFVEKVSAKRKGTTVSIVDIFKNVPARQKFLKKGSTELKHVIDTFIQVALPQLNIHFEIYHNGKLVHKLTKTDKIEDRVFEIFGKEIAKNTSFHSAELSFIKLQGLIGNSFIGRKSNKNQYIFINNRFIKSNLISSAIKNAYTGHIHRDLQPTYFLFLNIKPQLVDVNVHPRKLEVKFEGERSIYSAVYNFFSKNLDSSGLLTERIDEESVGTSTNDFADTQKTIFMKGFPFVARETYVKQQGNISSFTKKNNSFNKVSRVNDALNFTKSLYSKPGSEPDFINDELIKNLEENDVESAFLQDEAIESLPIQIFNTYIVVQKVGEVLFIDQHAAAEKILFEKLINNIKSIQTKPLLIPELIDLANNNQKEIILDKTEELTDIGFIISDFGDKTIQVSEIPELSDISDFKNIINDFFKKEEELGINASNEIIEKYNTTKSIYLKIATIACHGSIRAGQKLSVEEMKKIINDINFLKPPYNCPHGRPIMWKMSKYDIEKKFNRNI